MMTAEQLKGILAMNLMAYRIEYPEYADIQVVPVRDEELYKEDKDVATLLEEGYELIDMNAFGDANGRIGSVVILGKKRIPST